MPAANQGGTAVADETLLVLSGVGVPPYSARGLTQTLTPIAGAAAQRRTVNGTLVDVAPPQFRKYQSSISCTDQQPPALDGIWPGLQVTVDCVAELSYPTPPGDPSPAPPPSRTAVTGSARYEGDFTFYRPQLVCLVIGFSVSRDEYGALVAWSLDLEEI